MSIFTQTTTEATTNQRATQATAWAAMTASMAMMPTTQTCQNQQQASQRQHNQRQPQAMPTPANLFAQAENTPVFCFFYTYQPSHTHFAKRSKEIVQRPEEILNHAHKGGARI